MVVAVIALAVSAGLTLLGDEIRGAIESMAGRVSGNCHSGMRGSDLLSVTTTTMQARSSAVRDRPWSARPWVAGVGIFVAVLTLDAMLKAWAQESLATPVCVTSWMCLAVHHNPGLFLGMVPMAPDSTLSALHWLVLPPVLAWLGWRVLTLDRVPFNACYALVAGGLVGNLADRAEGAVIDYLGFGPITGQREVGVH